MLNNICIQTEKRSHYASSDQYPSREMGQTWQNRKDSLCLEIKGTFLIIIMQEDFFLHTVCFKISAFRQKRNITCASSDQCPSTRNGANLAE